jgi:hypothetical protein
VKHHEAIAFVRARYPDAKLERYGDTFRKRYTIINVCGHAFDDNRRLSKYCRPERAWKKVALRIKRRERG